MRDLSQIPFYERFTACCAGGIGCGAALQEGEGERGRADTPLGAVDNILQMMDENKQLALRIDGAIQSASQEVTNLRTELTATNRRLAELNSGGDPMENNQHGTQGLDYGNMKMSRSGTLQSQEKYTNG